MPEFWRSPVVLLYQGDCREVLAGMDPESVHCFVTSPPYFGLRQYQGNEKNGIGLETTAEEYLDNLMHVFRDARRVLRADGILWVNMGESRNDTPGNGRGGWSTLEGGIPPANIAGPTRQKDSRLDSLNRMGIPEQFSLSMQDDGWIWRDTIIWAKKAPMPETVNSTRWEQHRVRVKGGNRGREAQRVGANRERPQQDHNGRDFQSSTEWAACPGCDKCAPDGLVLRRGSWRTTASHEYIFMFVKKSGYYADGDSVREVVTGNTHSRGPKPHDMPKQAEPGKGIKYNSSFEAATWGVVSDRNRRSVWSDIAPEPFTGGEHYAVFPSDLPRLCIQASTSERGVCPECGAQWARVVERSPMEINRSHNHPPELRTRTSGTMTKPPESITTGWAPTCAHGLDPVPAVVCDIFAGSGTVGVVAQRLSRRAVLVELSEDYCKLAQKRLEGVALPLSQQTR